MAWPLSDPWVTAIPDRGVPAHQQRLREQHVRGFARGVRFGRDAEATGPAVKAVTRHGLEVAHPDGYWRARLIFDV